MKFSPYPTWVPEPGDRFHWILVEEGTRLVSWHPTEDALVGACVQWEGNRFHGWYFEKSPTRALWDLDAYRFKFRKVFG